MSIQNNTLLWNAGGLKLGDDFIGPSHYPLLIPIKSILRLDDLQQFISEQPDVDMNFWAPYFEQAYAIVEKMLLKIAAGSSPDLLAVLSQYDGNAVEVMNTAARKFAESRGLTFQLAPQPLESPHTVEVTFVKNPSNGHLFVIPATLFALDNNAHFWREILEERPRLGGRYYYMVVWPNGSLTPPTPFSVAGPAQVLTINQ